MAIALYFGGSIAMHVFQQDAIVSAVRLSALCLALFQRLWRSLLHLVSSHAYNARC